MGCFLRRTAVLITAFFSLAVGAAADSTLYLVRHAEKESDGTRDPSLTAQGQVRALEIANLLGNEKLLKVFSTDYKRTQETAVPTAKRMGVNVTPYDPRALAAFAETLKTADETVLVVGHSNTTPYLASLLSGKEFPALEEHQYDHMYVILLADDGTVTARIDYISPHTH